MTNDIHPLSIAVIGAGNWGARVVQTIDRAENMYLTGIVSCGLMAGTRIREFDARIWPTVEAMLEDQRPDGVALAVPPNVIGNIASTLIDEHIPLFAEKPFTCSEQAARSLILAARRNDMSLMVDFIYLYHAAFQRLLTHTSAFSSPLTIESFGGNKGPVRNTVPAYWDYGPHDISMALATAGLDCHPTNIEKLSGGAWKHSVRLTLEWSDGSTACLNFGNCFDTRVRQFSVTDGQNLAVFDDSGSAPLMINGSEIQTEWTAPLDTAVQEFNRAIHQHDTAHLTQDIAVKTNEILEWVGKEMDGKW